MSSIGIEGPFFEPESGALIRAQAAPAVGRVAERLAQPLLPAFVPWSVWRLLAIAAMACGLGLALLPFSVTAVSASTSAEQFSDKLSCSASLTESLTASTDQIIAPGSGRFHSASVCHSAARTRLGVGLGMVALGFALAGGGRIYTQGRGSEGPMFVTDED